MEGERVEPAPHEYEQLLATASPEYHTSAFDENDIAELFYTSSEILKAELREPFWKGRATGAHWK